MVWLIHANYQTSFYQFSIDEESELALLPRYGISGKDNLNTIRSCCPNSRAVCTNGTVYALNGKTNEWIKISTSSGNSGGGSSGGGVSPDDIATDEEIKDIFWGDGGGSPSGDTPETHIATDDEIKDVFW